MSDNKVMLDLDSEQLRDMLANRLYGGARVSDMARIVAEGRADRALDALRSLAADGLLVRG